MDINSDMKKGSNSSDKRVPPNPLQPTSSHVSSKAAEASGYRHSQPTMATIADDDDRLLARIGYTPV